MDQKHHWIKTSSRTFLSVRYESSDARCERSEPGRGGTHTITVTLCATEFVFVTASSRTFLSVRYESSDARCERSEPGRGEKQILGASHAVSREADPLYH